MMEDRQPGKVLTSWKEIAVYLGKGVRTAQRWERDLGLPILRPTGAGYKSTVVAHPDALDRWLRLRWSQRRPQHTALRGGNGDGSMSRPQLTQHIQTSRQLRAANSALVEELRKSLELLHQKCRMMFLDSGNRTVHSPSISASSATDLPRHVTQ